MSDTTMERTLVLLRHAKAVHEPMPDPDRPLSRRGHADAAAVGRWFLEAGHEFELVICSPSVRTRETWADVEQAGLTPRHVRYDDRVYDASVDDLLDALAEVPDDVTSVLVIGHAPAIPELAELLTDPDRSDSEAVLALERSFPTSCFAALTVSSSWPILAEQSAVLGEVAAPRG